jgi:DNA-binding NtrC family response regulator
MSDARRKVMEEREQATPAILTREMEEFVELAADTSVPVLITGESGSGKTFLARLIHERSRRRNGPFENLACGGLPESLIARELFGHAEGAYTGSGKGSQGIVQAARGGTLVLNELDAVPISQQAALLDLVEKRRIRMVGRPAGEEVDIRIIATTNVDISEAVRSNFLRRDLIFRLQYLTFDVPPLRERMDQLPALAESLFSKVWAEISGNGSRCPALSRPALAALESYPWPGNLRELETVLFRLALRARRKGVEPIGTRAVRYVLDQVASGLGLAAQGQESDTMGSQAASRYRAPKDPAEERRRIEEALELAGGNRTEAARILKMSRGTIQERVKRYGLRARGRDDSGRGR